LLHERRPLGDFALDERAQLRGFIGATSVRSSRIFPGWSLFCSDFAETSYNVCTMSFGVPAGAMMANQAISS
jgi:hypothetical protein